MRAATEWCKAAKGKATWDYLYIPEDVFGRFSGNTIAALAQACAPALTELRQGKAEAEAYPLFAGLEGAFDQRREEKPIVAQEVIEQLPPRLKKAALEAIELYRFLENKPDVNLAPSFTALLGPTDELATATLSGKLMPYLPKTPVEQADWFEPDLRRVDSRMVKHYEDMARNLKRTLLYKTGLSPLGLLRNCLDYTLNDNTKLGGVFGDIKTAFRFAGAREVLSRIGFVNEFRNTKVAHQQSALTDAKQAREALVKWVDAAALIWSSGVQPAT
ncbi:MAG TPA: hypothetical protein VLA73_07990 [Burkholderiales bacterium]|nr:hypothetical protein [Burkholderiales bacterium]